jgi:hypothetical protein
MECFDRLTSEIALSSHVALTQRPRLPVMGPLALPRPQTLSDWRPRTSQLASSTGTDLMAAAGATVGEYRPERPHARTALGRAVDLEGPGDHRNLQRQPG